MAVSGQNKMCVSGLAYHEGGNGKGNRPDQDRIEIQYNTATHLVLPDPDSVCKPHIEEFLTYSQKALIRRVNLW
jgi:hypothetical protein